MKKILIALMLLCNVAQAGPAVIWNGQCALVLPKNGFCFSAAGKKSLIDLGTTNPSIGGGYVASVGSIGISVVAGVGMFWIKTGAGNTAWSSPILSGGAMTANYAVITDGVGALSTEQYLSKVRGGTGLNTSGVTDGQLLVGNSTGNVFALAGLTSVANQTTVTPGAGSITIGTAQSIGTTSTPSFAGTTVNNAGTLKLLELTANGANFLSFKAPDLLAGDISWTLPGTDSTATQALTSNGSGTLGWTSYQTPITPGTISTTTTGVTIGSGTNATVGPSTTVDIATASAGAAGLLTSADWSTFNGKQSALTPGTISTTTTGVTIGNGTNATVGPSTTVDIATASAGATGLLTSADWSTFNGKQSTITNPVTGTGTNTYAAYWNSGTSIAAEQYLSKARGGTGLDASGVTNGQLLIGNTTGNVFALAGLTATSNQTTVTPGASSITIGTVQDINTSSTPQFAGVAVGQVAASGYLDAKGTLRLYGGTSGYVGLAPAAAAGGTTYTLPAADGAANDVLKTNGSAVLSWTAQAASSKPYWSGYHGGDCAFPNNSATMAVFGVDATCSFTEKTNSGFGAVSSAVSGSDKVSGIVFTPASTAALNICVNFGIISPATSVPVYYELADTAGTPIVIVQGMAISDVGGNQNPATLCGIYVPTSTASKTILLKGKVPSGSATVQNNTNVLSSIEWTIFTL